MNSILLKSLWYFYIPLFQNTYMHTLENKFDAFQVSMLIGIEVHMAIVVHTTVYCLYSLTYC